MKHVSVLLDAAVEVLNIKAEGIYVDGTFGRGGHSQRILEALSPQGKLICFDQDAEAISAGRTRWSDESRMTFIHRNFSELRSALSEIGIDSIDGMILDLGVSSPQLDEAERGFSYHQEGQLDMRMDQRQSLTAYDVVNTYSETDLRTYIYRYGEEKKAGRIAKLICKARAEEPIRTTLQLAEIIKKAFSPSERRDHHPARRTFQAIRIMVNNELGALEDVLPQAIELLAMDGVLSVITFHSLEDRIVKQIFQNYSGKCTCPPGLPVCVCGNKKIIKAPSAKVPDNAEIEANPRARSARLRYAIKLEG